MAHAIKANRQMMNSADMQAPNHHHNWVRRCIARVKAKRYARKIMRTLHEIEDIHAGRKPAKSLEDFLRDF
jgi:hypothetical protein